MLEGMPEIQFDGVSKRFGERQAVFAEFGASWVFGN